MVGEREKGQAKVRKRMAREERRRGMHPIVDGKRWGERERKREEKRMRAIKGIEKTTMAAERGRTHAGHACLHPSRRQEMPRHPSTAAAATKRRQERM